MGNHATTLETQVYIYSRYISAVKIEGKLCWKIQSMLIIYHLSLAN